MPTIKQHTRTSDDPYTETVPYSELWVWEKRMSLVFPGKAKDVRVGFLCPRCRTQLPPLDHGEATTCPSCDLHMQLWGNGLDCR